MTALCELEETVPGVGVYTPGLSLLECDAARLTDFGLSKVQRSIERLNVHVHDPSVLADALAVSPDTVTHVHIEYHKAGTFNNLKWALAELNTENLRFLSVAGMRLSEWEADCLYALYNLPVMEVGGVTHNPPPQPKGERVTEGDNWYRRFGNNVAVQVRCLPFFDITTENLIVDCDSQFHPKYYPTEGVKTLTLYGVIADVEALFAFADRFKGQGLYITTSDSQMTRWVNALSIRLRSRGIEFFMEVG